MASSSPQRSKSYQMGAFAMFLLFVAALATSALDDIDGPWLWFGVVIQAGALVTLVVCLVRVVRGQRDDYWRERGRDPRNPGRSTP